MVGVHLEYDLAAEKHFKGRLEKMAGLDATIWLDELGALAESQQRRRLSEEKETPDGGAWKAWTTTYVKTRHAGHSMLENEGNLIDSIDYFVSGGKALIGSSLVYAARQHADRPYLGFSEENIAEIGVALDGFMERALA
jgi:phage gpG-like protein